MLLQSPRTPRRRFFELPPNDLDNALHQPAPLALTLGILEHALFVHVPPIIPAAGEQNATATSPIADRVESRREAADGLGKIRVCNHSPPVVLDSVADPPPVLDRVREVGQGDVEGPVARYGLLVHGDGHV